MSDAGPVRLESDQDWTDLLLRCSCSLHGYLSHLAFGIPIGYIYTGFLSERGVPAPECVTESEFCAEKCTQHGDSENRNRRSECRSLRGALNFETASLLVAMLLARRSDSEHACGLTVGACSQ